jgi:alpha-galactosidase
VLPDRADLVHLATATTSVILDCGTGVPAILHWGASLGAGVDLDALARSLDRPVGFAGLDRDAPLSLVPEHGAGYPGRPGLAGHRPGGVAWAPRFVPAGHEVEGTRLVARSLDEAAGLSLVSEVALDPSSEALVVALTLENRGSTRYLLERLDVTLPLTSHAAELVTFTGRWCREAQPQRRAWADGNWVAENRRGRTSHDHLPLVWAGTTGFGEWSGEVWGAHLAWSGNHSVAAERLADGRRCLQLGELLHPGEVVLAPGESYRTPQVIAVHSADGLTPASWRFHRFQRARPHHPGPDRPRPVLVNTWEAQYFDHDLDRLFRLAAAAAEVGAERFVLDDGWFHGRRDDRAGLGDWWVDAEVYPDGLTPLIDHVRALGMEFGIWVEPEMVNPDSDLYRAHPEWALATQGYEAVLGRNQLVLDLGRPEAFDHVLTQLDALLRDHDIAFVKWDMNRDHAQGSGASGAAGTHRQTQAVYRLMDELAARHPGVELESCASGGGRIDLEVLRRAVRVWTSDCNDALERQLIQRGTSMLVPPEVMGAHIGPGTAHTTGRRHRMAFRAVTALFGHLGVEADLLAMDDHERQVLAAAIALHKELRPLLHGGDVVRFDLDDPATLAHGVYAADRSAAVVAYVQLATSGPLVPGPLRLPGLHADRSYRLTRLRLPGELGGLTWGEPAWMADGVVLTGRQLAAAGVRPPPLLPESAALIHLQAVESP